MTALDGAAVATSLSDGSLFATAGMSSPSTTGLIGPRRLLVIQTIRIARLNSLPVPLVHDALVLVSGKGPKDSNDCGKTNLLAAIGLLLGDPEWRTAGTIGHQVAGMLFSEGHSGSPRGQYSDATHGYAVGVFAFPGQAERTAATVWCRINRTTASNQPYVQVRAATGVLLAAGDTTRERHDAAERLWASLASQPTWGGNEYARRLYGTSPRCLAHVTYRGFVRSDDRTLLAMKSTVFNPETIARSLIALTGDPEEFTQKRDLRRDIAADQEELARL
jgi:chromosome segregation protein